MLLKEAGQRSTNSIQGVLAAGVGTATLVGFNLRLVCYNKICIHLLDTFRRGSSLCRTRLLVQLLRAWCRADQDDMMSAQILQPEASVGGVGVRSSGATGNATPGPSIAEADTDESGVNGSPAEIDGGSEGNGIDRGSAGAISAGKIRPPSLLLHPTEEINSVLQAIAGSCSSSIGDTGDLADDVRPSRPLFDKPTELLDVCEVRCVGAAAMRNYRRNNARSRLLVLSASSRFPCPQDEVLCFGISAEFYGQTTTRADKKRDKRQK